jgi:predicted alpha/beta-fold hydrolase
MPFTPHSAYKPPLFFASPHVQTIFPTLFRKVTGVTYRRIRIDTPDGDFLDSDLSSVNSDRVAVILHGLEGDSQRSYVKGMVRALNRRGWDALAVNFRGCGGEPNRMPRMYHSGETEDLDTVMRSVGTTASYRCAALVGFSLGGNVILKYLGERGTDHHPLIRAAAAVSVPCHLKACSVRLGEPGNRLYAKRFLKLLRAKIALKARVNPESIRLDLFKDVVTLKDFDDRYTAPLHGFKDADDYYARASSLPFLKSIRVPTLLLNAKDDPFLAEPCYPVSDARDNSHLFLETPDHGGHVGFLAFNKEGEYWSEKRVGTFLEDAIHSIA